MEFCIHFFLFIVLFSKDCSGNCDEERTTLARLKDDIFCGYDPYMRPVEHQNNQTLIILYFNPRRIDFEEGENKLYVYSWIFMTWVDVHLNWNPENFDNIDYINVPPSRIWVPDITVYNKMDLDLDMESHPAVVRSNGRIYTVVMTDFTAYCSMDLTYWPNDEHTCIATLGSKSYHGLHLDFDFYNNMAIKMGTFHPNRQWKLKSVNATRKVTKLGKKNGTVYLVTVLYEFKVQRHPNFIISTVYIPVLLLSSTVLLSLLLPFSSERCYNTLALSAIGHVSYLQYLGSILPHNADKSILIVSYVRDSLVMTIFALFMTVWIDRMTNTTEVPLWLFNLLKSWQSTPYSRMFLIGKNDSHQNSEEDNLVNTDICTTSNWSAWIVVIQRSIFVIYLIIYSIMFLTFL